MTGTKAKIAIAALALALVMGSAQIASGAAGESGSSPHGDATAAKSGASQGVVHSCPSRRVSARSGVARQISVSCRLPELMRANRVDRAPGLIVGRPDDGRILGLDQDRDLARYRPRRGFVGHDRFVVLRRSHGALWRLVVRVNVIEDGPLAPPANPNCGSPQVEETNYQTALEFEVTCSGNGLAPLKIVAKPSKGSLLSVRESSSGNSRTLAITYGPSALFVGSDGIRVEASEPGSSTVVPVSIKVLPWRMRALGDSATAGFGFLGTSGNEMSNLDECVPIEPLNDRCSSNSDAPEGYKGALTWSDDFGLQNNVSWAAQFANQWQGGGHITAPEMFQNRAVTGSTPSDWLLANGQLRGRLTTIIDENPDLIAFTLGVNPLLSMVLEELKQAACIRSSTTIAAVESCLKPLFEEVVLRQRLEAIYRALLGAPDAEVVTFQYHLAVPVPALIFFAPWQVEALINYLNAEIAAAVAGVRAAVPAQAGRLTLIEAQVNPLAPDPLKVPRFNLGIPANPAQSWKPTKCPQSTALVDGPSHQASSVQTSLRSEYTTNFCEGTAWTITADYGIHPNREGYVRYAKALVNVAVADNLVPKLP